ncbi:LysR family transcriptional regulator [Kitasatospora purpeofusca]|uniref:LysR family transcriptional regulator n=1 Tax=Kitasatospora purpeofusca TaxID=67352 RepID=UPI0038630A68|nr:LysR family transcriptional regulator [Kitasatospora purpeofusca]
MDLDLAQVRAFLATAEHLHFRRAAESLALTQQGLSKRIAGLERELGVRLFDRGRAAVELTAAGRRFLGPAREALAAGEAAVAAVREAVPPLRLDVWGHLFAPLRTVREALDAAPGPAVEVGSVRDLAAAAAALARGETAAGFGRYHHHGVSGADGGSAAAGPDGTDGRALAHRLVRLEPVDAVLRADHPLAARPFLRPAELAALRLVPPAAPGRLEFLSRFVERFGSRLLPGEANLGLDHLLERVRTVPDGFTLLPAELPVDPGAGLRAVPLVEPTPLYAWSLVWHRDRPHPGLPSLLAAFAEAGVARRWLEYRPERDWLPEADVQAAARAAAVTGTA